MSSKRVLGIALVLVLIALASLACRKPQPTPTPPRPTPVATTPAPTPPPTPRPTTPAPTPVPTALAPTPPPTPAPLTLNVDLNEFVITPSDMTVQVGQAVTFNLKNGGRFPHNLFFHGLTAINDKMGANLQAGQSRTVTVTFDQSGLFPSYCPVGPHENRGMYGALKVVGPPAAQPSVKIWAPAQGASVVGPDVVVAAAIRGFDIDASAIGSSANKPGSGHWHLLLDGKLVGPVGKLQSVLKALALGQHTVKAELHNNDHSALTPPVEDSITFNVIAPTPAPIPTPQVQAPVFSLAILEPEVESVVTRSQITVKGTTSPDAVVSVNGQTATVDAAGAFSVPVTLRPGPNVIEVVASDFANHQQSAVLTAIYTP
ncbi:MAG: hypothetical protein HY671_15385 [Chloroflexi bacterium]|nr:hypothetical protein [Chloroflexota bacterium]